MSDAGFDNVRFPLAIGPGASVGAQWQTEVLALASGQEVRNARWAASRRRWDVASAVVSVADLGVLSAFFEERRGRLRGFRFRDPADCSSAPFGQPVSALDQPLGTGDGETAAFQLVKAYGALLKPVTKPVLESLVLAVDGAALASGWSADMLTGRVTFDAAPAPGAVITAGFLFDWPVRFDTDRLDTTHEVAGAGRAVSIPIVELPWTEG